MDGLDGVFEELEEVKAQQENKHHTADMAGSKWSFTAMVRSGRTPGLCGICRKGNHWKVECPLRKEESAKGVARMENNKSSDQSPEGPGRGQSTQRAPVKKVLLNKTWSK